MKCLLLTSGKNTEIHFFVNQCRQLWYLQPELVDPLWPQHANISVISIFDNVFKLLVLVNVFVKYV